MSKLFRQLEFTGGLNTYDDKTRIQNNQLQIATNIDILRDGSIKKRKGFEIKNNFDDSFNWSKLLPSGIIIKILKYKGYWFFFYSNGTVVSNYRENLIIDVIEDGLNLENPRATSDYGWGYEITKKINGDGFKICKYIAIYDRSNDPQTDINEFGYGKASIETLDIEETRVINPGDIFWIGGFSTPYKQDVSLNVYMPTGNNIRFWIDTIGNTYWDSELKNIAYMHSLYYFQNIKLEDSVAFNNDKILSDADNLYKLSDVKYEPVTNNKAFSIVGDAFVVLKRDSGEILNKVKISNKGPINFTYDKFENKIYIIQEWLPDPDNPETQVNLQIIDLYTLQVIENHSYNKTDTVKPRAIFSVAVDKEYVYFLRELDLADALGHKIERINKNTFQLEQRFEDNPWDTVYLIRSVNVDYFGNRVFIGLLDNDYYSNDHAVGYIFDKSTTGVINDIINQKLGSIINPYLSSNSTELLSTIFIYDNYLFGVSVGRISVYKKNSGSNDYNFVSDTTFGGLQDIAIYSKFYGDLQSQYMALIVVYNNNLSYTLFSFKEERIDSMITLYNGIKGGIKISKDQIYREKKIYIDNIDKPVRIFAYPDRSVHPPSAYDPPFLNGQYNYKIKYRDKNGLESIESDIISGVSTNRNPIIIEDIYLPSYMDTVVIYRQKVGETDWVFVAETSDRYFIDNGDNENIIEKPAGKQYKAGKFITNYYQRLFVAGVIEKENYIFFSEVDIPEYFPIENFIIIHQCKNITGLNVFNENLYIFTDVGIFRLSGYSIENFNIISINENITDVINKTIKEYQNYLIFQSNESIYIFDGYNNIDIGTTIKPDLIYNENNFATIYDDKYFLFIPDTVLVYNLKLKNWVKYDWNFDYVDIIDKKLISTKNSLIYNLLTGYNDAGANITSKIKTKRYEIGDALTRKVFERLHFIFGKKNSSVTIKIQIDDNTIEEYTFNTQTNESGEKVLKKIRPSRGRGKYFEIEFAEQSGSDTFRLYGIEAKYREIQAR